MQAFKILFPSILASMQDFNYESFFTRKIYFLQAFPNQEKKIFLQELIKILFKFNILLVFSPSIR